MEFNGKPIIFCEYDDDFLVEDGSDEEDQLSLGDDCMFLLTFFIAFVFNWIGFFLSFCSTNTIAGRYGAISGFGLSLLKWILIVRESCSSQEASSIMPRYGEDGCQDRHLETIQVPFYLLTTFAGLHFSRTGRLHRV
ncbi:NEDD4 family-interacting protein 1 isoform X2 [Callorhinchus milii]|uniref:NEDD4 family-interacting protein 1-like n=1 Tax=Callorhinchus milii TaxID=7868 RepID=A0A4W3IY78_CALMI|nr:NEDD4 family-interacting protein 1 isoform X2 [Callorhinchus milii]|eukprot:gi/632968804/ref/XP_007900729.1/ PREDICTED: NEDD4 family-interacting protein 1-like isoform X2 [Callorhinchus milii]